MLHWRRLEKQALQFMHKTRPSLALPRYDYGQEPVIIKRKEFWELDKTAWIMAKFMPSLPHETDGLIYQGGADVYVPGTHTHIMKWKFSHMNSVDFQVRSAGCDRPQVKVPLSYPVDGVA